MCDFTFFHPASWEGLQENPRKKAGKVFARCSTVSTVLHFVTPTKNFVSEICEKNCHDKYTQLKAVTARLQTATSNVYQFQSKITALVHRH